MSLLDVLRCAQGLGAGGLRKTAVVSQTRHGGGEGDKSRQDASDTHFDRCCVMKVNPIYGLDDEVSDKLKKIDSRAVNEW